MKTLDEQAMDFMKVKVFPAKGSAHENVKDFLRVVRKDAIREGMRRAAELCDPYFHEETYNDADWGLDNAAREIKSSILLAADNLKEGE